MNPSAYRHDNVHSQSCSRKEIITIAIGDIHGMAEMLDRLLTEIEAFLRKRRWLRRTKYIFLGDYVDRGPNSREVVSKLRGFSKTNDVICLRGNHEELMINYGRDVSRSSAFRRNGGDKTLLSYEKHKQQFRSDQRWMASLPTSYEDSLRFYVHAGIRPHTPLDQQEDGVKLWIRDDFLNFSGAFPKFVVHGHTPTIIVDDSDLPTVRENRCNIDTGAFYGGQLSAAFFNENECKPFHLISVK